MFGSRCTEERILALAGVVQCAAIVDSLATEGKTDEGSINTSIDAFFLRDNDQLKLFFETPIHVQPGLLRLSELFSGNPSEGIRRQTGYAFQMIQLARQMADRPDMLGVIGADIDRMEVLRANLADDELRSQVGELYQKTISKLNFRIQVQGQHGYLRQEQTASTIRAILFCGIRFAHLWRQQGGSQMDFFFRKSQIRDIAERLVKNSDTTFH